MPDLLKRFYCGIVGWREQQVPDGTLILTSPTGHTYTTKPGSALLFPTLRQAERRLNEDYLAECKPPPF